MFKLAGKKGLSDPQVIKISQQLDGEIVMWQKIIQEIHPLAK
ncbi:aspartyl-phosphate phosphatase Spo0E family protein [Vibrio vulnificus]|nr:aspartyl-phosphate phosphatase Spo0E family protein [Vibrio vulnificus]